MTESSFSRLEATSHLDELSNAEHEFPDLAPRKFGPPVDQDLEPPSPILTVIRERNLASTFRLSHCAVDLCSKQPLEVESGTMA